MGAGIIYQNTPHPAHRVGSERFTVFINHFLCIPMICRNNGRPLFFKKFIHDFFNAQIDCFTSLHSSRHNTGVSHHVHIGEIEYDQIVGVGSNSINDRLRYFKSTHFGFLIIGGNISR